MSQDQSLKVALDFELIFQTSHPKIGANKIEKKME